MNTISIYGTLALCKENSMGWFCKIIQKYISNLLLQKLFFLLFFNSKVKTLLLISYLLISRLHIFEYIIKNNWSEK